MPLAKNVNTYLFEKNAINSLIEICSKRNTIFNSYSVYIIDHYFKKSEKFNSYIKQEDLKVYLDTNNEPTTDQVDDITSIVKKNSNVIPSTIVGIGGGSTLDVAKAVSNLLTNGGKAADYQGWDLVKFPGVYKIGVPTISGTGAEASRTCVMMNEKKNLKLGMNSEHTIFDHLILDPNLTDTVPREQYFYTGMDTYIHCVESLEGSHRHSLADAYSREALNLCREVFLGDEDMMSENNRQKLMAASYLGGSALANSFVGVVHPFSAGLSMVFHTHHCIGNCIIMNQMDEYYPKSVNEFRKMLEKQNIVLPRQIGNNLEKSQYKKLYESTIIHEKPLKNALGDSFNTILSIDKVTEIFKKM